MRVLYTLLFYLALPAVLARLYWRGIKAPQYRQRWHERLGVYAPRTFKPLIWLHAVSVGEVEAAAGLVRWLLSQYPEHGILVTTTTPTGSSRVQALFGGQVEHVYLPYDLPPVVECFLAHFQPQCAVFMEKELWPNLFAACQKKAIPLYVVNARLSAQSARAYLKIPALIQPTLACITTIAAQTDDDRDRFIEIGAQPEQVQVLGNLKFDLPIDKALLDEGTALNRRLFGERFVWILASTHGDEEAQLLRVYRQLKPSIPTLLCMIAPRHPERFDVVDSLCREQGYAVVRRSSGQPVTSNTDIYLADSLGELKLLYAAADVAFVGGSLVSVGGHNVLEPAVIGVPVIFGPWMFNFQDIADRMRVLGAAIQCHSAYAVGEAVMKLHDDREERQHLVRQALAFVQQNQGSLARIAALLSAALEVQIP
ncbi:MAG: hypothetical protein RL563_1869 [Pseudomonadota bacterium]|jgi:3-deoxy-D-manno-octulosonic-acid transferase